MHNEMLDFLVDMELEYDKVISVLLVDYNDYEEWKDVLPLYKNMRKEGITLWQAAQRLWLSIAMNVVKRLFLDFFVASKKDAEEQIERALLFKDMIKGYLKAKSVI